MGQVNLAQTLHADQVAEPSLSAGGKSQGTLKADGKEYSVFMFSDSESVTEAVSDFLQEVNQQKTDAESLQEFEFVHITQQLMENEQEISELLHELMQQEESPESQRSHQEAGRREGVKPQNNSKPQGKDPSTQHSAPQGKGEVVYTSLFSLARSFHTTLNQTRQGQKTENRQQERTPENKENRQLITNFTAQKGEKLVLQENRYDREGERRQHKEDEREGQHQDQQQKKDEEISRDKKKKKVLSVQSVEAARSNNSMAAPPRRVQAAAAGPGSSSANKPLGSVESIYVRFMALMARILGQAEYEAHQLYVRIKERTDHVDALTLLISKINSEKGAIDWSNNEEMKQLVDKARAIGVDIPQDKYSWSEEEKKLLKENIQMRKDSMEKMTQLERTDMQRFLQEASQCHQARSNVLKLLKEVMDTIIANMRP